MAAAQTAEQKAAAQKAAADSQPTATAGQEAAAKKATEQLQVLGPVAVLPLKAGGERYVYRGAPVGDDFTDEGIAHAKSVGLVGVPKK